MFYNYHNFRMVFLSAKIFVRHVEPGLYGHQGDMPNYPGCQEKRHGQSDTCFIDAKTKADIFTATKRCLIC